MLSIDWFPHRMWIGGEWVAARSGDARQVLDPATGAVIAEIPRGGVAEAEAAIQAARRCFVSRDWSSIGPEGRVVILRRMAELIRSHLGELAVLETKDTGKPIADSRSGVLNAASRFDGFAQLVEGKSVQAHVPDGPHSIIHQPVGVVAQIIPWNYPITQAAGRMAASIAAGTTCVLKPSELAPLSTLALASLLERSGLPAGAVNIVTGPGREVGRYLAESDDVDLLVFIGSTEVGRELMRLAAGNLKKIALELGGKSANVVFADADLDDAVNGAASAIFANAGQNCAAGSRLLIEESLHDEFLERLVAKARAIKVGNGLDPETQMGPLISADQREKVEHWISVGRHDGARVVAGGGRPKGPEFENGFFVEPTIFAGVRPDMSVAQNEIFGPVLSVIPFSTEAEAVHIANDTKYGLAGAVWTQEVEKGRRVLEAMQVGISWMNTYHACPVDAPWGGYKQSSIGRVLGESELYEYLEAKQVNVKL